MKETNLNTKPQEQKFKAELVAPAGDIERFDVALTFGADSIYLAGKNFGLRAGCDNFSFDELKAATLKAHLVGKNVFVTLNIFPFDDDFSPIEKFVEYLLSVHVDGVIVSDIGLIGFLSKRFPTLKIHVSTQANVINAATAKHYADMGVKRIVLGRELNLTRVRKIRDSLPDNVMLEAFVHGAMCMSYSGRCLLSSYFTKRSANRGECTQSCRWEYDLIEKSRGDTLTIDENKYGTAILSSKDLNMLAHLPDLADAGIGAFKIEGRTKSAYYVGCVVNAYRRAIDFFINGGKVLPRDIENEVEKTSNRGFFTGFYYDEKIEPSTSLREGYKFCAIAVSKEAGGTLVQMRNRFKSGDVLEVLSPTEIHNSTVTIGEMTDENNNVIEDIKLVGQRVLLKDIYLQPNDILRRPM